MLYHVSRNGQTYGPYTLEDLRRYVASGNILPSDLAKSDDMTEWAPVGQILGIAPAAPAAYQQPAQQPAPPGYGAPAPGMAIYPDAPDLSWGLVLLFGFFTCTLFMFVWNLVVAAWLKRVQPNSNAIFYYSVATVLAVLQVVLGTHMQTNALQPGTSVFHWGWMYYQAHPLRNLMGLVVWVARLIARFTMRSNLEEHFNTVEPLGLSLSGVMTFFFGGIYFQYHLNRINELKRVARYRGAAI